MNRCSVSLALMGITIASAAALALDADRVHTGSEVIHATVDFPADGGCGSLLFNADGTYENGYTWRYNGVAPPYYGAFAECYSGVGAVCSIDLDLTQVGAYQGQTIDVYVWNDAGGVPAEVLCVRTDIDPGAPAYWPSISRHRITLEGCCVDGGFWAGYWPNVPGNGSVYFIGADLDGPGGCPFTNIAPGIGWPTGWNNVSVAWGPTAAVGIGVELSECGGTPTQATTWGSVKRLYD